jgi:arylsulfatase A-like enzyme
MDIYPTLLDAAGIKADGLDLDGVSLLPLLQKTGSFKQQDMVFHFPHYTGATGPYSSIIHGDWKLIHFYNDEAGAYQLFNLADDPAESHNACQDHPETVKQLAQLLSEQLKSLSAELPIKNPDYAPDSKSLQNQSSAYSRALEFYQAKESKLKNGK